ncbi:MAG: Fic/DOC family N-terminal domain-containing protein, partial [Chlamydiota bacterium]
MSKPYVPDPFPLEDLDYKRLFSLASDANVAVGRYDGALQGVVNPAVILSPLAKQEAVLSSKIEGTQATLDEVLEHQAGMVKEGEKEQDIQEIINYRQALFAGYHDLKERAMTLLFVRQLHKILMQSVRGKDKMPGEFRTDQNWIGTPGCTIEKASFIPPDPLHLTEHLEAWQKYIESDDIDFLVQTALVHAQFELIHPFKDGNGRIGRILIPLFLYQKKRLFYPAFYLSAYLEAHREEYYCRLQNISERRDWNGWIAFFLRAVESQAKSDYDKVQAILKLYEEMKTTVQQITRSRFTIKVIDAIFNRPIFNTNYFVEHSEINKTTA